MWLGKTNIADTITGDTVHIVRCLDDPSTHEPTMWHFDPTKPPPDKLSDVTIYYCNILSQSGQIVRPPQSVTFWTSKFGRFVTVWQTDLLQYFIPKSVTFSLHISVHLCCDILSLRNKWSIFPENSAIFTNFHMWQLILKGLCMSLTINHSSARTWSGPRDWDLLFLFFFWKCHKYFRIYIHSYKFQFMC